MRLDFWREILILTTWMIAWFKICFVLKHVDYTSCLFNSLSKFNLADIILNNKVIVYLKVFSAYLYYKTFDKEE